MVNAYAQINSPEGSRKDSPQLYAFGSSTLGRGTYSTLDNLQKVKFEKWECSNRMCLMIIKYSILEAFQDSISESQSATIFAKNEKAETSNLLAKLISMKYKGRENIREYIMEVSNLTTKLQSLKLELDEDLIVKSGIVSQYTMSSKPSMNGVTK
ncbi:hypothetical protein CR513_50845, partial [Mucuna pruriens]